MCNLQRPIHTWLSEEIGAEHYTDDVFLRYWWHRIGSEVRIWDTNQVLKLSFLSRETSASLRTAGMFVSEMNDDPSQFESDVTESIFPPCLAFRRGSQTVIEVPDRQIERESETHMPA
jgi:hypothetical protein